MVENSLTFLLSLVFSKLNAQVDEHGFEIEPFSWAKIEISNYLPVERT